MCMCLIHVYHAYETRLTLDDSMSEVNERRFNTYLNRDLNSYFNRGATISLHEKKDFDKKFVEKKWAQKS